METLSCLLVGARESDYLMGFKPREGMAKEVKVSYLLFADDMLVFCETLQDQITHLSRQLV